MTAAKRPRCATRIGKGGARGGAALHATRMEPSLLLDHRDGVRLVGRVAVEGQVDVGDVDFISANADFRAFVELATRAIVIDFALVERV